MFSKIIVVLRSSHRDAYFNRVVLHLRLNSLKDICKEVQFLVKMHVVDFTKNEHYHKLFFKPFDHKCEITTSYHIFSHNNYFCRAPLEGCFCVWKIWEISQANIWNNKKCFMLPINNCTKKLHCGCENFTKCLQNLPGTTKCKNISIILLSFYYLLFLFMRKQEECIFVLSDFI